MGSLCRSSSDRGTGSTSLWPISFHLRCCSLAIALSSSKSSPRSAFATSPPRATRAAARYRTVLSCAKFHYTGPYILILLSYFIACPLVVYRSRVLKPRTSVGTDTFHSRGCVCGCISVFFRVHVVYVYSLVCLPFIQCLNAFAYV